MANTTNFNWETPDDTDLVKDGAAAIRTLGSAIDTSLVDLKGGTTGQVLSKATNTDMDFTWVAQDDSNAIQNALLTTTGDTIYASGASTPARLAIGTTGQVLTVAGGVPSWATPAGGGGKVLQVVSTAKTDTYSQSSGGWTDVTGLSVSITPTANTSKILVLVSLSASGGFANNSSAAKLVRGSTDIFIGDTASNRTRVTIPLLQGETQYPYSNHISFLDSPATTSSTTYKIQVIGLPTGGQVFVNRGQTDTDSSTFTRSASSITVMEIGA